MYVAQNYFTTSSKIVNNAIFRPEGCITLEKF